MPEIKLYYFDARGIAEPIRMILKYGEIEFEDIRTPILSHPPKVPEDLKTNCTWGTVPVVEFEGKKLAQSLAITRYFAKKVKLVPEDDFEAALCDEYVDAARDMFLAWMPAAREQDPEKKDVITKETLVTVKQRFLDVFEAAIKANDGKHLVGSNLTWADIYVAHVLNSVQLFLKLDTVTKENPAVQSLCIEVFSTPAIKDWVDCRPLTTF